MSLIIEGPTPPRWNMKSAPQGRCSLNACLRRETGLTIALINNMPDAALEDTELQFFELLDMASGDVPVFLKLYSLTGIPRTENGQRHLNRFYCGMDDLWGAEFDGVIVTGTEPRQADLRQEPYWATLGMLFDWAARNTTSAVLSCLAAHASVLHRDGVPRHRLADKQFGVFEASVQCKHPFGAQLKRSVHFPHSRWNELWASELREAGYVLLTESEKAGVDVFVKQMEKSLFLHFQGHPEYGAQTLLKEYRRDIKRFVRGERETYPTLPHGYFSPTATTALEEFRSTALAEREESTMDRFPESAIGNLQKTWNSSAQCIYQNWLKHMFFVKHGTASPLFSIEQPTAIAKANSI